MDINFIMTNKKKPSDDPYDESLNKRSYEIFPSLASAAKVLLVLIGTVVAVVLILEVFPK